MKKFALVLVAFILSSIYLFAQDYTVLEPVVKKEPVILISGKNITYYKLSKRNPIEYSVEGVNKLYIYTRKRIDSNDKPEPYSIKYYFDNSDEFTYESDKIKSDIKAVYLNKSFKRRPSEFYKKPIIIPENAKTLFVISERSNDDVDINILAVYGSKKKKLKPKGDFDKTIIKTGERLKYYKLNSVIPTVIHPKESGKLIVYSRLRMSDNEKKSYSITLKDKNANKKVYRFDNSIISKESVYKSSNILKLPSKYHKTIIDIPGKYGEIEFSSNDPVDAKFVFKKDKEQRVWKDIPSINKSEEVFLQYKNSKTNRKYSRISEEMNYSFKIKGPQKIRILARGEFQFDMHSNNDYEIIVKKNDKIENTYKLSCFRSSEVEYKDNDEMIPGTLDRIYINVPEGEHTYTLSVNNNNKTSLIRVSKEAGK